MWFQEDSDSSSDEEEEMEEEEEARRNAIAAIVALKIKERASMFSHGLNLEGRRRRNRGLSRKVLLHPGNSPWQKLYDAGDDQALITVTGFHLKGALLGLASR